MSGSDRPRGSSTRMTSEALFLAGIAGSPGVAIGPAIIVDRGRAGVSRRRIPKHLADDEVKRFAAAVKTASNSLREVAARASGGAAESSILEAYIMMVEDETLREDVERRVRIDLRCAEWALDSTVLEMSMQLKAAEDPYLAERSHDIEFVGDHILRAMTGRRTLSSVPANHEPGILVAHDLSPAETAGLSKERVLGIVTEVGTRTSHTAILARALEIPAVVGVGNILGRVGHAERMIVDGVHGRVVVGPNDAILLEAEERSRRYDALTQGLFEARKRPAQTRCGVPIVIKGNIELSLEAQIALEHGAKGIGLYRTEFLYVDRREPPTEDEQYTTYRSVVETVFPLPVTLRTFDIGGDKFVSAFRVPNEMNPALGLRAVRLGLRWPDLMKAQLRAMLRASAHGAVRIMIPMVANVAELEQVQVLMAEARAEVQAAGQDMADDVPLGVMIEVPAAALMADEFARRSAFMSIGTNDLVQYTLAVDRSSPKLAHLASFFDPAILRLIRNVIEQGRLADCPVVVCGAMASDLLAAILLVGMGLRELSMEAAAIPEIKEALSRVDLAEAEQAAVRALTATTSGAVEAELEVFSQRLADLIDPG